MLFQSLTKEINKFIKIIGQFHFGGLLEKFLKDLFLKKCFGFLSRTNQLSQISQASNLETPTLTSLQQLLTNYTNLLMRAAKFELFSQIAFDKVWHEGLSFKLKQNGISGKLLNLIKDFLKSIKQRIVLNGQSSSWVDVNVGVSHGSILGSLLFLMCINDLTSDLSSSAKLFAEDALLFSVVFNNLAKVQDWALQWKMSFNPNISKQAQDVIFS